MRDARHSGVALLATRLSVLGDDPCGGSEVVLWEDAAILRNAGIPVRVYGCAAREGAPVSLIPLRTSNAQLNTLEYVGQLLRREPEALFIAYNEPALAGWVPDRTIVRFDWNMPLPRYWNWPVWLPRFQRARYVFPSISERQMFLEAHPNIPTLGAITLPNAVDLRLFRPLDNRTVAHPAVSLRVGFAGQWVPRKGIRELMQAWQTVKSELPSAELVLAGDALMWKAIVEPAHSTVCAGYIREMESRGLVRIVGALPRSSMPEFWNSVNIAVVPSLYEPFGLVALEALACGVPVVAAAVGGLKEIIVEGECGLLVAPGDATALARALLALLTNGALRAHLAEGARRRAQTFSLERRASELSELVLQRAEKAA